MKEFDDDINPQDLINDNIVECPICGALPTNIIETPIRGGLTKTFIEFACGDTYDPTNDAALIAQIEQYQRQQRETQDEKQIQKEMI